MNGNIRGRVVCVFPGTFSGGGGKDLMLGMLRTTQIFSFL